MVPSMVQQMLGLVTDLHSNGYVLGSFSLAQVIIDGHGDVVGRGESGGAANERSGDAGGSGVVRRDALSRRRARIVVAVLRGVGDDSRDELNGLERGDGE